MRTLIAGAQDTWDQIVPTLVDMGVAKAVDSDELTMLCEYVAQYEDYLSKYKAASWDDKDRFANKMRKAWNSFDRIAARFGLTPGDRARMQVRGDEEKTDADFESLLV